MKRPALRKIGASQSKNGSVGEQRKLQQSTSRLGVLNMLNDRVGAYPDEDFVGIDPDQVDEVRDYLVVKYNEWVREKRRAQQENKEGDGR